MSHKFEHSSPITDEQIENGYKTAMKQTVRPQDAKEIKKVVSEVINLLSTPQLKQLCESKGLSIVEWVELDAEDIKTFPMIRAFIMTNNGLRRFEKIKGVYCFTTERQTHIGNKTVVDNDVTHWCELPQRKGNN